MAIVAAVVITGGVMAVVMAVVAAAVLMVPGKGSGKNPEKSFLRRERGVLLGFPMRKGVQVGVISVPFNTLPV